jgi:hypothetical protein
MLRSINKYGVTYLPLVPPILVVMVVPQAAAARAAAQGALRGSVAQKGVHRGLQGEVPTHGDHARVRAHGECGHRRVFTDSAEESRRHGTTELLAKITDPEIGEAHRRDGNTTNELWRIAGAATSRRLIRSGGVDDEGASCARVKGTRVMCQSATLRIGSGVTTPLKIIPYYCLNQSIWHLSNNTEVACRCC